MWYDRVMISIHALLAESDKGVPRKEFVEQLFLSTLSLRRATASCGGCAADLPISIHALLAESDLLLHVVQISDAGISIHALLAESD